MSRRTPADDTVNPNPPDDTHRCLARGCARMIPLRLFMCARHWRLVPSEIQRRIYKCYTRGQEHSLRKITPEWKQAATEGIEAVRQIEAAQP